MLAYERAVEHARDRVAVSNSTRWLVQHYFEEGRADRALEVARMGAAVYSASGLDILGQLTERMGRYDEAEGAYVAMAGRYPSEAFRLPAFYVRYRRTAWAMANIARRPRRPRRSSFPRNEAGVNGGAP